MFQTVTPNLLLSFTVMAKHWQWGDVAVAVAKVQCLFSKEAAVTVAVSQART